MDHNDLEQIVSLVTQQVMAVLDKDSAMPAAEDSLMVLVPASASVCWFLPS